jgi:hypothetical protein
MPVPKQLIDDAARLDPRRWAAFWHAALKFPTDPTDKNLRDWADTVRFAVDVAHSFTLAIQIASTSTQPALAAQAAALLADIDAIAEIARSTSDPSALMAGVVTPLLYDGNQALLWRVSELYSAHIERAILGDVPREALQEGLLADLERGWDSAAAASEAAAKSIQDAIDAALDRAFSWQTAVLVVGAAVGVGYLWLRSKRGSE